MNNTVSTDSSAGLPAYAADDEIDLRELIALLWAGKWWITLFTAFSTLTAGLYAFTATPMYKVESVVQLRDESKSGGLGGQLGGLAALAGVSVGGGDSNREYALKLLKSRRLVQAFIEEENLLPRLYADRWDDQARSWILKPGLFSDEPPKPPTAWHGYGTFTSSVYSLAEDPKTGVLTLSMTWHEPEEATRWLRRFLSKADTMLTQLVIEQARGNLKYLEDQLQSASTAEVRQAVAGMMENEMKKLMVASNVERGALTIIDPPYVPLSPFKPKKQLILALGFMLGGMLGVMFVLVRNAFRGSAAGRAD